MIRDERVVRARRDGLHGEEDEDGENDGESKEDAEEFHVNCVRGRPEISIAEKYTID